MWQLGVFPKCFVCATWEWVTSDVVFVVCYSACWAAGVIQQFVSTQDTWSLSQPSRGNPQLFGIVEDADETRPWRGLSPLTSCLWMRMEWFVIVCELLLTTTWQLQNTAHKNHLLTCFMSSRIIRRFVILLVIKNIQFYMGGIHDSSFTLDVIFV